MEFIVINIYLSLYYKYVILDAGFTEIISNIAFTFAVSITSYLSYLKFWKSVRKFILML